MICKSDIRPILTEPNKCEKTDNLLLKGINLIKNS